MTDLSSVQPEPVYVRVLAELLARRYEPSDQSHQDLLNHLLALPGGHGRWERAITAENAYAQFQEKLGAEEAERAAAAAIQRASATPGPDQSIPDSLDTAAPVQNQLDDVWRTIGEWGEEWLKEEPPPRSWLLTHTDKSGKKRGVLPLGKVAMLVGAGGVSKTWNMTDLALAVAAGGKWNGLDVEDHGRVLLMLGEDDVDDARARLYWSAKARGFDDRAIAQAKRRITVLPLAGRQMALGASRTATHQEGLPVTALFWELVERLEKGSDSPDLEPWRLVIIDTASRAGGPDIETENGMATRFIQAMERLAAPKHGRPVVWLTHHTNKTSRREGHSQASDAAAATASRGSGALIDTPRFLATLEPWKRYEGAPELVTFAVKKTNCGRCPPDVVLVRTEHGPLKVATDNDKEEWKACEEANKPDTPKRTSRSSSPSRPDRSWSDGPEDRLGDGRN